MNGTIDFRKRHLDEEGVSGEVGSDEKGWRGSRSGRLAE